METFFIHNTKSVLVFRNRDKIQKTYSSLAYLNMSNQDQNN